MKGFTSRTIAATLALTLSAGALYAEATDCSQNLTGAQTGMSYTLIGQSEVTYTVNAGVSAGVEAGGEYSETINKGYYQGSDGRIVAVNCSTLAVM